MSVMEQSGSAVVNVVGRSKRRERRITPPPAPIAALREWYMGEVHALVTEIEPQLRSGYYREARRHDGDRWSWRGVDRNDPRLDLEVNQPPSIRLEHLCQERIGDDNAGLVLAVSPNTENVVDLQDYLPSAGEAMALDVLAEAKRRGIVAPPEEGTSVWSAWEKAREGDPNLPWPQPEPLRGEVAQ